jgi:hypothetical protein
MLANEIRIQLLRLTESIPDAKPLIEFQCKNFETVFAELGPQETILISDSRKTFAYLGNSGNSTYMPLEQVDMDAVNRICNSLDVQIISASPEQYDAIGCFVPLNQTITPVIKRVAEAIDKIFALAMRC